MTRESLTLITLLLAQLNKLAETCNDPQNLGAILDSEQTAYFEGVAFGVGMARDELAIVLARAMAEGTKLSPSLM